MLAIDWRAPLGVLILIDHRDEFPGADDPLLEIPVVGMSRAGAEHQQTKQQDPHAISSRPVVLRDSHASGVPGSTR